MKVKTKVADVVGVNDNISEVTYFCEHLSSGEYLSGEYLLSGEYGAREQQTRVLGSVSGQLLCSRGEDGLHHRRHHHQHHRPHHHHNLPFPDQSYCHFSCRNTIFQSITVDNFSLQVAAGYDNGDVKVFLAIFISMMMIYI